MAENQLAEQSISELIDEIGSEFEDDLNNILSGQNLDIGSMKNSLVMIIHKYASVLNAKKASKLSLDETLVAAAAGHIANYLLVNESKFKNLSESKSRANFILITKKFAIYEIYKVLNPKRIAGETKSDNFRDNLIVGGLKYAQKYGGVSQSETQKIVKEFAKKIEKSRSTIDKILQR